MAEPPHPCIAESSFGVNAGSSAARPNTARYSRTAASRSAVVDRDRVVIPVLTAPAGGDIAAPGVDIERM
jgi:hypothetical protein